jgi:hypothetical protein
LQRVIPISRWREYSERSQEGGRVDCTNCSESTFGLAEIPIPV